MPLFNKGRKVLTDNSMMKSLMDIQEKLMQEKISKRQKELPLEPKQEVIEDIPEIKQEVVKESPTIKSETETAFEMDTEKKVRFLYKNIEVVPMK